ncbi:MAG: hypothetical protein H6865_07575 [Rhodospirillales bacterium]|nr:hypothetical protein [Alphaproteobacteria bacterium]MCB9987474.1 hypothetical protein [Rhodospirillales bacterium]USO07550.1 MAG: hypothetical protein H6866_09080 [Rhodospirillales bacterium]
MNWQKLDRTETAKIIQRVGQTPDGALFSSTTSEATVAELPFYRGIMLLRLTNYATLPSFSLDFLSDGTSFYLLDGSPGPIQKVAARGALNLTERNVADYVDFFFRHVTTEEGDIYLIRDPDTLPFLDSLSLDQQIQIKRRHSEVTSAYNRDDDTFSVQADLYFAGTLLKATLTVQADGGIEVSNHAMLLGDQGRDGNGNGAHTGRM